MLRTLNRFLLIACAGLLTAVAAGCGSNQGCADYARVACQRQTDCSAYRGKINSADVDACTSIISRSCELSTQAPDSNWRQDSATACSQALQAAPCEVILAGPLPVACQPAGNRGLGAACADGFQCQSLFCNRPSAHDCGICAPQHQAGETCGNGSYCGGGLQCAGDGTCAPLRNPGEVCDQSFSCQPTLACSTGICQAPTVGQSCAGQYDYCDVNALQGCDFNTLACQPIDYSVSQVGESCGVDAINGTFIDCESAAYCKTGSAQSFGVCTLLPKEGEACAIVNGSAGTVYQLCLSPTTCISGTCQIFDRASCN